VPVEPTKKEVHVTELAGPDDRWVSVTDASRIGRRQEHTIRSWIAQGLLPVNPVRVGMNKKTRQVRLSDLATLTPIVDPDAGIATDLGTLDLPSIPKQQQQLMEQMAALQQEVAGEFASLGGHFRDLAGKHERFAEETREIWQVQQQQYQTLTHRDEEYQQQLQQVRDSLVEQATSYSQELQQAREDLTVFVVQTEQTLRQVLSDRVEQSEVVLRQALETVRKTSEEETEQVRKQVAGLGAAIWGAHDEVVHAFDRLDAHTGQQFTQVANRFESLDTTFGELQGEIQKQVERVSQLEAELLARIGQLATQLAGLESPWQERAQASEQEVHQLRRDLDAQGHLQQTLQQQLDEERKAREELAQQVGELLQQNQHKGKT